ncbi:MAG: hypothetical protein JETT_3762 [Candidatus Jettenia ecosi]|uniref:Uncharacterized protein n=1 Tax=Candidatus Jettenia ecosi TaxID=2494326 RepID=A0A533Q5Z2_9BACT|nr:MAG: hypothetical protein JETT_3762 [Candidatus Jettenia ecosi]
MATVAITHKIVDSYLAAIDSSIFDSQANSFHKTLTGAVVKHVPMLKHVLTPPTGHSKMSMPHLP